MKQYTHDTRDGISLSLVWFDELPGKGTTPLREANCLSSEILSASMSRISMNWPDWMHCTSAWEIGSDAGDSIIPGRACNGPHVAGWGRTGIGGWLSEGTTLPSSPPSVPGTDEATDEWE